MIASERRIDFLQDALDRPSAEAVVDFRRVVHNPPDGAPARSQRST